MRRKRPLLLDPDEIEAGNVICDVDMQPGSLPPAKDIVSIPQQNSPALSQAQQIAYENVSRVRTFSRRAHFQKLVEQEAGLYASTLYFGFDDDGLIVWVSFKKPLKNARIPNINYAYVQALGTMDMFTCRMTQRVTQLHFDIHEPYKGAWTQMQQLVLQLTQALLNKNWLTDGFSSSGQAMSLDDPEEPGRTSPPGHDKAQRLLAGFDHEHVEIAARNLQMLANAGVKQPAATLFMNSEGKVTNILHSRPESAELQFLATEEQTDDYTTVIRVGLRGKEFDLISPYETVTESQKRVLKCMDCILNNRQQIT